jgi:hypothetical protein
MSEEEKYFCEYCGYYSQSKERCTSCGRDIADLFTQPISFRLPAWGMMRIRLLALSSAEQVWKELHDVWKYLEEHTNHQFLPSQLEKFNTQEETVELYGSESGVSRMREALRDRGTIEFEELPDEAIPSRPRAPRPAHWREPYVPRRRR